MSSRSRAESVGAVLVFIAGLVLYLGAARPDMAWGDSADFAVCAHFLGVAHPTGYPLITLLGKLAAMVPAGPLGFRVCLLSVFVAAVLLGVFFRLASALGRSPVVGLYATAMLALSTFLWEQAVSIEVYALNLFFCVLILGLLLNGKRGAVALTAFFFVGALGLGNHGTLVFPALMLGAVGLALERRRFLRVFAAGGLMIMLGLALYLSLPLLSARSVIFDWNHPETPKNLFNLLTGLDFWVIGEYKATTMWETTKSLAGSIAAQASLPWIAAFAAALFVKDGRRVEKGMLIGVIVLTAFFPIMYPTKEKESFFLISYASFILMGAIGFAEIWRRIDPGRKKMWPAAALAALVVIHSGLLLNRNKDIAAARYDDSPAVYERQILKNARRDALIFLDHVADDTVAPPLYYQFALGARQDVFLFHRLYLAFPWYMEYMKERARGQGHPLSIPGIDIEAERLKSYKVTIEEYERLRAGKTMNTVSIDIRTRKIWDANRQRAPMYINTPQRFRFSVLSDGVPLEPAGFLFAMNGNQRDAGAPRPAPAGKVFDALMADYFIQRAARFTAKERHADAVSCLLKALEYQKQAWIYGELAVAYLKLGDTEKSEYYQRLYQEDRLKKYDFR